MSSPLSRLSATFGKLFRKWAMRLIYIKEQVPLSDLFSAFAVVFPKVIPVCPMISMTSTFGRQKVMVFITESRMCLNYKEKRVALSDFRDFRSPVRGGRNVRKSFAPSLAREVLERGMRMESTIVIFGDTAKVSLTNGYWALIDLADIPLVQGRKWHPTLRLVSFDARAPVRPLNKPRARALIDPSRRHRATLKYRLT